MGTGIVKYRNNEIALSVLAQRIGVTEAKALEIAVVETKVSAGDHHLVVDLIQVWVITEEDRCY